MSTIKIIRLEQTEEGALGALLLDKKLFCFTLEPDDQDPERNQIPSGVYQIQPYSGYKWKDTYEILVPGHTDVLFHAGNTEEDTLMCVILGLYPDRLKGERAILNSGSTFRRFLSFMHAYYPKGCMAEFINLY